MIDPWVNSYQSGDEQYAVEKGGYEQVEFDKAKSCVFRRFNNKDNVKILIISSQEASKQFNDEYFDWVYLDARHYYIGILEDLTLWFPKMKIGGYLCGDNFEYNLNYGIIEAVHTFVSINELVQRGTIYDQDDKRLKIIGNQYWIQKKKI